MTLLSSTSSGVVAPVLEDSRIGYLGILVLEWWLERCQSIVRFNAVFMDECECRYEVIMLARLENQHGWEFHGGLLDKVSSFKFQG
jgi:hypothetical protein